MQKKTNYKYPPPPGVVACTTWCANEIQRIDKLEFVSYDYYVEYNTELHKVALDPRMFISAGFKRSELIDGETMIYYANKEDIKLENFHVAKGCYNPKVQCVKDKNYKQECIDALMCQIIL